MSSSSYVSSEVKKAISLRIILASQSAIRRKALDLLGLSYECIPANIDEKSIRDQDPLKMARMISEAKAYALAQHEQGVIVSGDAFLKFEGRILEKPNSLDEAHAMLSMLSGKKYTLITGLAVFDTHTKKMRSTIATCDVYFRSISPAEILDYCKRYPVLKFAGAHETDGVVLFSRRIEGSCLIETAIPMDELVIFLSHIEQDRYNI